MQWICGFLCEKCQKGDPPPKKGVIFIDFWKFTPQRAGTLFRVSRGTPRVWRKKRQKTRFLTPIFSAIPYFCCFLVKIDQICKKMSFFAHFVGFLYKSSLRGLFVAFLPPNRRFQSIFTTGFFYLLNVLFCGKIQIGSSFPCIYGITYFYLDFQQFDTAQLTWICTQIEGKMQSTRGPYSPLKGGYDAYRAPLVPLHCIENRKPNISRCKNAMDMWVNLTENTYKITEI